MERDMASKFRVAAVGVLLLTLAFSTVQAIPAMPQPRTQGRAESADLMAAAWDWLASFLTPRRPVTPRSPATHSGQQKEGSQLDPNGGNH
jgi:hypothetical protein